MFKSIGTTLIERKQAIENSKKKFQTVEQVAVMFFREQYPTFISQIATHYNEQENILILSTLNKGLAGELLFCVGELKAHLSAHKLRVGRIIVRQPIPS
jgi:hypothetical protein